jgi:transposase
MLLHECPALTVHLTCRKEHPFAIRQLCIEKRGEGWTFAKIATFLAIPVSTVKDIVRHYREHKQVSPLKRSGRPTLTDERIDRHIIREVSKDRTVSAAKLVEKVRNDFGVEVSESTVRNRIKAEGFNGRAARKKPFLSKKHMDARLQYARQYEHYGDDEWKHVIFSDETSVEPHGATGRVWVWRKPGEEMNPACLRPTFKSGRVCLMVWGCITWEGVGALHVCNQSVNGVYYKSILEQNLHATVDVMGLSSNYEFVQDGAPAHRASVVRSYLNENGIRLLNHPAQSPDLNPIENIWAIIKRQLSQKPATSIEDLKTRIQELWYDIDPSVVQGLYRTMPRRIQDVLKTRGGHTRY